MSSNSHKAHPKISAQAENLVAIVETPAGCRNKYKLDEETGRMKLSKIMPQGMVFPFDFGYIPDTRGPDGDPLDVLILHDEATFPGCQVDCRLVGVLNAREFRDGRESRNDRIVAVVAASLQFASVHELSDLEPALVRQLEEFFINYKKAREVRFEITGRRNAKAATALLQAHKTPQ